MAGFRSVLVVFMFTALVATVTTGQGVAAQGVRAQGAPLQVPCTPLTVTAQRASLPEAPIPRAPKSQADASATYSAPMTPQRMIPDEEYTVAVTVTNTTTRTWPKSDFVLSYRWKLWDGTDYTRPSNRVETTLPADLAPGQTVKLDARVKTPISVDLGNQRESFALDWDMRNRRTDKWLSDTDEVPPLTQHVTVEFPTSDQLGLEKFYQYNGMNAGAGWTAMVNQFAGNAVVGYNALSNPSRGLTTFVRLNYNSLDSSNSYVGPGWSLSTSSLTRLGSPLQFHGLLPGDYPPKITLADGDGTSHLFTLNKHDSHDPKRWTYDSPAGVHLYLQRTGSQDESHTWLMTRPDRTQLFFDRQGFQTAVVDRNGNELRLHYVYTNHGNRNTGVLTHITDAAGRRTLTLDYYQRGDDFSFFTNNVRTPGKNLTNASIIDQLASITDISGRRITFAYSDRGRLQEVVDGAGTAEQKVFLFFYDDHGKMIRVNDALGHGTQLRYFDDHPNKGRVRELVDRRNNTMGFGYADADGKEGTAISSTVTDANGHTSTTVIDGYGRPTKLTNAKNEVTELAWDDDNNVRLLKEANGAVNTWVFDGRTGFPVEVRDAEANARNHPPTKLGYRTALDGYVAELTEKTSPEGRKWTFGYDERGNLTSVTDPKGSATPDPNDFTTRNTYDNFGQLLTSTDANGHTTKFEDYDLVGYPRKITDALNCSELFGYDVVGNVVWSTDARQKISTFTYDIFKRTLTSKVPKDADKNDYIVTPAPRYDANDNILTTTAPNGAVTTATYDPTGNLASITKPKDDPKDPAKRTTLEYDAAGNLIKETQPKGNLTTQNPDDFITTNIYDQLNQLIAVTDADKNRTTYAYDNVGNVVTVVDPRKSATQDPNDFTAKYTYDLNHRVSKVTDAAGHSTGQEYDRDGMVIATTDQEDNKTLVALDERAAVREVKVPHKLDGNGAIVYRSTRYDYDAVGNRTKVTTPKGVDTPDDPGDFVYEVVYDELNRMKEQLTPFDKDHPRVKTPDRTFYSYDEVGRLIEVSAPPSGGQSVRNVTRNSYFDNGWVRSSTDSWDIVTSYDYDALGNQLSRKITAAGGVISRDISWTYYPDGKLRTRSDDGAPPGRDVLVVDNHDAATAVAGNWGTAGPGDGHEGFDYRLHGAGTGSDTFTWNVDVPRNGKYEVFVRYAPTATATDATYTVEHDGGSETKTVDQTQSAGEWVSLGSFGYAEDAIKKITLSDKANGTVVADAVRLVRDGGGEADNEQKRFGYRYDPNDNMVEMTDSSPDAKADSYTIGYTGLSQIARIEEKLKGAVAKTTDFTYDPNGNTKTRSHNAQNAVYEYDVRDLVEKVTNTDTTPNAKANVTTFAYTKRMQKSLETKANGNTVDYRYFLDQRLQHEVEKKSDGTTIVNEHTLEYDPNGHRTKDISKKMNGDNTSDYLDFVHSYAYDPRDRSEKVVKSDAVNGNELETELYEHDANNNVTRQTVAGRTTSFTFDRNRLVSSQLDQTTTNHTYDPFGRLSKVTSGITLIEKYAYDGFDRVVEHQKLQENGRDRITIRNSYDPLDRTTTRTENPGGNEKKTEYSYLGLSGEVLTEELAGKLDKSYQYSPSGERLSQVKHKEDGTAESSFYGYNPHTDVEMLTDEKGDSKATYGYTAFGRDDEESFTGVDKPDPQDPTKDIYNPYRFNAKRFDHATGDYDMGFRDYDPGRNTFLSRDMYNGALADLNLVKNPWTGNRYAFAGGNPISRIEIDGHDWFDDFIDVITNVVADITAANDPPPHLEPGVPVNDPKNTPEYDSLVLYMFDEMVINSGSDQVRTLKDLNSVDCIQREAMAGGTGTGCIAAAFGLWAGMVAPEAEWDHKRTIIDAMKMEARGDNFTPIPGTTGKIAADVWSNIHFGYVGIEAGFDAGTLHWGADMADLVTQDKFDEGDRVAIQIGIDLRAKYSPSELRPEHIHQEIMARYEDLKTKGRICSMNTKCKY
jgi:RHS repeat-associated protein